jgi:hypothetical protein
MFSSGKITSFFIYFIIFMSLSRVDGSLRGKHIGGPKYDTHRNNRGGDRMLLTDNFFYCNVLELDGISVPNSAAIEPEWICILEGGKAQETTTFFFDENVKTHLGDQLSEVSVTKMRIPWEAVNGTTIASGHSDITVSNDPSKRERHLAPKFGRQKVLIVRVLGNDVKPDNWISDLVDGFFNPNDVNLVSISLVII